MCTRVYRILLMALLLIGLFLNPCAKAAPSATEKAMKITVTIDRGRVRRLHRLDCSVRRQIARSG